jgi:hypothetical protein
MFGQTMGTYWNIAKFGVVVILISALGRWGISLAGVPYFPRGNVIFSIVLACTYVTLCYGAFTPRLYNLTFLQALVPPVIIVLVGQLLVVASTLVTYMLGMDSYFNNPEALNVAEKMAFGDAMVTRLAAIVPNVISGAVACSIGQGLGKLMPKRAE